MHYEPILQALHQHRVRYLVVGGLAVNLHGIPRMTFDLDIVADLEEENLKALLAALSGLGFRPRLPVDPAELLNAEQRRRWMEERNLRAFTFIGSPDGSGEIDLILDHCLNFEAAYTRRSDLQMQDYLIPLIAVDDLLAMKRVSPRAQDTADTEILEKIKGEQDQRQV